MLKYIFAGVILLSSLSVISMLLFTVYALIINWS